MFPAKPPSPRSQTFLVHQISTLIIQNRPFDAQLTSSITKSHPPWTTHSVSEILRSIPRFFFESPRSIGRQKTFRHRTPLKQRNLRTETYKLNNNILVLGPAAHRDPEKVNLGLDKALEFYFWVKSHFGFQHNETTCREMAIVLARGNRLKGLWDFLKETDGRAKGLVTPQSVTCLIKVLGEEGFVNGALAAFIG